MWKRPSDDELLARGRVEWAFEKANARPHRDADGREVRVSIEETSRVGPSFSTSTFSSVLSDVLTFGRAAGEIRPGAGAYVLVVRVDGDITSVEQFEHRHEAAAAGSVLIERLDRDTPA